MSSKDTAPAAEATPTWTEEHVQNGINFDDYIDSTFASRYTAAPILKYDFPEEGKPANVVYQMVKDLRSLDAIPRLNLASFVTTWMEPEAEKLMMEALNVNFVDADEYPSSQEIQTRCVEMLARLTHSPAPKGKAVGTSAIGSSEAILLGALALKKRWQEMPRNAGKTVRPNLVMGAQVHVCWDKFTRYFDVEKRAVPCEPGRYVSTPELMRTLIDENTIGVVAVFGSTYNGEFEDVAAIDRMCEEINAEKGWDLMIHVDGASGGFVAPFIFPDTLWDFRLPHVASMNMSGHKYGLVYPGLGWVMWRSEEYLPESMCFYANYLGTVERSITLNFSKGAANVVAQYYQFLRLGLSGYRKIMSNLRLIAKRLRLELEKTGHFEILSKELGVPLVAFRLAPVVGADGKKAERQVKLLRVTIREDFCMTMVDQLVGDLLAALNWLDNHFILTKEQVAALPLVAAELKGRKVAQLDSSILPDAIKSAVNIRPC